MITCTFEKGHTTSLRHVGGHAIVEKDGKILVTKRAAHLSLEAGKWALPGGFLDRDETAAQGALRELLEETGWEGKVISLFRINTNPNRPHEDRQNVALDFLVTPLRQTEKPGEEVSELEWIAIDALPAPESFAFDHGESIKHYLSYRQKPFSLPLVD